MQKQDYKTVRDIADIAAYLGGADVISFDCSLLPGLQPEDQETMQRILAAFAKPSLKETRH